MEQHIKNALEYHNELSELTKLVKSIEYSMEYIESAFTHIKDDTNNMAAMALSLAQADLQKSHAVLKERLSEIENKLAASYF